VIKVAVTQRIDTWQDYGEIRDSIDIQLLDWILACNFLPIQVPNNLCGKEEEVLSNWINQIQPDAFILSGGGDIGLDENRDMSEVFILDYAFKKKLPVLGICRGMQNLILREGQELVSVEGHVSTRHKLIGSGDIKVPEEVNSFHKLGIYSCPENYNVLAFADDNSIEAIVHNHIPWEGWMWHPEREINFNSFELTRFSSLVMNNKDEKK
jgi:putative glutamine amidotransferase|tara:strand:+ start:390 stop:1019 length:630 start_codon:yes stop_codon:yes gene_type:complete